MTFLDHPSWQCVTPEGWADLEYMADSYNQPRLAAVPPKTQRVLIVTWKFRIEVEIDRSGVIVDAPDPIRIFLVGMSYAQWVEWCKRRGGFRISTREQEGL